MRLLKPTQELIEKYVLEFERRSAKPENAIRLLCEKFPDNKNFESVLLKSIVINVLYSTQIRAIIPIAKHIAALDIDEDVCRGTSEVIDRIAKVTVKGKRRNNYAFATKYCSFHNPAAYPIYDKYVDKLLTAYRKLDKFAKFRKADLRSYEEFKKVLDQFRTYYDLTDISPKELDKFLWGYGKKKFR